jgi:MFS transporter
VAHGSEETARESSGILSGARKILPLPASARGDAQAAFRASPFTRLAITHAFSMAGDALITMALAGSLFFDISPKAARGRVALSLLFTIAPFAVVAPLLGPIIDRTKGGRRLMVVVSMVGRAVCCLLIAREIHSLLLFPAALATLILSKGYIVAKASLVPAAIDDPGHLVEANSKLAVGGALVGLLAGIPGVAILQLLGARTLLRLDSLVLLAGAVTALRIVAARRPMVAPEAGAGPAPEAPAEATERQARLGTGILLAAGAMGSLRFTVGFMTFLVAFAFRRGHAAPWWYGLVLACSLGGNLLGSAIAPVLRGRFREQWIITGNLGFVAVVALVAGSLRTLHHRPAAALLGLAVGLAAGAAKIAFDALVQQDAPESIQSRAFARFEAAFQLVWVVGGLAPVAFIMSLTLGFTVITLIALGTLVSYGVLAYLADRGRLPGWFPRAWIEALSAATGPAEQA